MGRGEGPSLHGRSCARVVWAVGGEKSVCASRETRSKRCRDLNTFLFQKPLLVESNFI